MVKVGTRWWAGDAKKFIVLAIVEEGGHTWIHYRDEGPGPSNEYSCYLESFLQRFSQLPE